MALAGEIVAVNTPEGLAVTVVPASGVIAGGIVGRVLAHADEVKTTVTVNTYTDVSVQSGLHTYGL